MTIDHVAAARAEISSGIATPLYGFSGIQIAQGITAIIAMTRVNAPSFLYMDVDNRATDWNSKDMGNAAKKATETM